MELRTRVKNLLLDLNKDVYEKEEVLALSFLSAIAGESIFLLGYPGVAKSLIARRLKYAFKSDKAFEYLMNRFSTPDEIFGPISISKLKDDSYERVIAHYLPDANVVFLDEIWKAGPSIQNTLLTIINEKVYRNGVKEQKVDIRGLIAASNELPEKNQGLEALWDRFLIRYVVDSVQNIPNFNAMISKPLKSYEDSVMAELKISDEEYKEWSALIESIEIPDEVFNIIHIIRQYLNELKDDKRIYVSDRRWRKIVRILRSSAFLNGRNAIDLMDCFLIVHCIWNTPEQIDNVKELVSKAIKMHGYSINLGTKSIRQEIIGFDEEVKNDTTFIKDVLGDEELVVSNNKFIEIKELEDHTDGKYILKSDWDALGFREWKETKVYDKSFKHISNINLKKKGQWSVILYQGHYGGHIDMELLTHKPQKKQKYTQKPNTRLAKQWDNVVDEIKISIEKEQEKLNAFKEKSLDYIASNLFVNSKLGLVITENLIHEERELTQLSLDIDKIKHYYDTIK